MPKGRYFNPMEEERAELAVCRKKEFLDTDFPD